MYKCGGCKGKGTYYDRQERNVVACDWCHTTGRLEYPSGSRYYARQKRLNIIGLKGMGQ